jgi:tetratricopeptide (TPR) repeat protein
MFRCEGSREAAFTFQRAVRLDQSGRSEDAKDLCRELAIDFPDFFDGHYFLGILSARSGSLDEAAEAFGRAAQANPTFLKAYFNRGVALTSLSRHEEALACYDRAAALDPEDASTQANRIGSLIDWKGWMTRSRLALPP